MRGAEEGGGGRRWNRCGGEEKDVYCEIDGIGCGNGTESDRSPSNSICILAMYDCIRYRKPISSNHLLCSTIAGVSNHIAIRLLHSFMHSFIETAKQEHLATALQYEKNKTKATSEPPPEEKKPLSYKKLMKLGNETDKREFGLFSNQAVQPIKEESKPKVNFAAFDKPKPSTKKKVVKPIRRSPGHKTETNDFITLNTKKRDLRTIEEIQLHMKRNPNDRSISPENKNQTKVKDRPAVKPPSQRRKSSSENISSKKDHEKSRKRRAASHVSESSEDSEGEAYYAKNYTSMIQQIMGRPKRYVIFL